MSYCRTYGKLISIYMRTITYNLYVISHTDFLEQYEVVVLEQEELVADQQFCKEDFTSSVTCQEADGTILKSLAIKDPVVGSLVVVPGDGPAAGVEDLVGEVLGGRSCRNPALKS